MKNLLLILLVTFVFQVNAQNCNDGFYPFYEGASWVTTSYNAKGVPSNIENYQIKNVTTGTNSLSAEVLATIIDSKGKDTSVVDYTMSCLNGVVKINMEKIMSNQLKNNPQMQNMELKFVGDDMEFPSALVVGQTLPDSKLKVEMYNAGTLFATMNITATNRTVAAKESITTTAGTFECFKISTTYNMEMMMMNVPIKNTFSSTEWISKGVGVVKSESYDKGGKLLGYNLLTKAPAKK
jgi:hypothetical protein